MDLTTFVEKVDLPHHTEIEKVELLALYGYLYRNETTFLLSSIVDTLASYGCPISNISRVRKNLAKSRSFRKVANGEYMLTATARESLKEEITNRLDDEVSIDSNSELLDETLFCGKRGYLDKLIYQINHCYKDNCFDACAVCMRRVFEIVLILSYENLGIQDEIKKDGEYLMLDRIASNAVNNSKLGLSRLKKEYDTIREIGNYAAHRIQYNTRKKDIDDIKQSYRVCLEELYYKAGLMT